LPILSDYIIGQSYYFVKYFFFQFLGQMSHNIPDVYDVAGFANPDKGFADGTAASFHRNAAMAGKLCRSFGVGMERSRDQSQNGNRAANGGGSPSGLGCVNSPVIRSTCLLPDIL
jgi:hypothetical protein